VALRDALLPVDPGGQALLQRDRGLLVGARRSLSRVQARPELCDLCAELPAPAARATSHLTT